MKRLALFSVLFLLTLQVALATFDLNDFTITGFSAEWGAYNGYASNLLPANNPTAATSPFWNSGQDWDVYPQPYWISFDLGSVRKVATFQFKSTGDSTHDTNEFELLYRNDPSSPFSSAGIFYGADASSTLQTFTLTTPILARYWKFNIISTHSIYQAYVAYVNFGIDEYTIDTFSVAGFSAQWLAYSGAATNLLPTNNPTKQLEPFWNSGADWNVYPQPYWVSFDFGTARKVVKFQFLARGDTTHDPNNFEIQYSSSSSGPFSVAGSFVGAAGSTSLQEFTLTTPVTAQYWKFNIINTHSQYQAWVSYVNFVTN